LDETNNEDLLGIRTRKMPLMVKQILLEKGIGPETATRIAMDLISIGKADKTEFERVLSDNELITPQIMFLSKQEIDNIAEIITKDFKERKEETIDRKKLREDLDNAGIRFMPVDMALFGRMITSEAFENVEASFQAAHAISTNKLEQEYDFFTAVDDVFDKSSRLKSQGSAMLDEAEYNSSCFYKYFALDTDEFIMNLTRGSGYQADIEEAKKVLKATIKGLVETLVFVNPKGKQNAFAAHNPPQTILVEIASKKIPMSYANAFLMPVYPTQEDLSTRSTKRLIEFVNKSIEKYKLQKNRFLFKFDEIDETINGAIEVTDIEDLINKINAEV